MTRLIDADALKEEYVKLGHCAETYEELYTSTEKLIDNAPTVEMPNWYKVYEDVKGTFERPQGKWIPKCLWDNTHIWICSECGNQNTHGITVEKACWKCGADMRKGGTE